MLKFKTEVINYLFILLGSAVMAFGIVGFLSPNHIATGGTAGLAIVLNHVFNLSIGTWMALINVPLLLITLKSLGKRFAIKTIVCIAAIVVLVDFFAKVIQLPALSANLMLATLYGGVTIGVGLGLIFKGGASAGGASILAKLFNEKFGIKSSTVILILDAIIVASAGFVFHSIELALWSLISIYVASKLIDTILVGAQSQKIVHISSIKNLHELSKIISDNLGISGTIIKGNDLQISEYKDIIFIMIDKNRLNELKQIVLQYDKDVKMVVMEATEILGK
jgi:uncharacterized membrane-anchored protein YitT (DUF2179 family)